MSSVRSFSFASVIGVDRDAVAFGVGDQHDRVALICIEIAPVRAGYTAAFIPYEGVIGGSIWTMEITPQNCTIFQAQADW